MLKDVWDYLQGLFRQLVSCERTHAPNDRPIQGQIERSLGLRLRRQIPKRINIDTIIDNFEGCSGGHHYIEVIFVRFSSGFGNTDDAVDGAKMARSYVHNVFRFNNLGLRQSSMDRYPPGHVTEAMKM